MTSHVKNDCGAAFDRFLQTGRLPSDLAPETAVMLAVALMQAAGPDLIRCERRGWGIRKGGDYEFGHSDEEASAFLLRRCRVLAHNHMVARGLARGPVLAV